MKKLLLYFAILCSINLYGQYNFGQIEIWNGSSSSTPKYLTEFSGNLYFSASNLSTSVKKLYKSNGTEAGTSPIVATLNGGNGYSPESLYAFNGGLYFTASVSGLGTELYITDGTDSGTTLLKDIRLGSSSGLDLNSNNEKVLFVEYNNELYFRGKVNGAIELWKTNGTPNGTVVVKSFLGTTIGQPKFVPKKNEKEILGVVYNNLIYFIVERGTDEELWKTDGTTANTELVKNGLKDVSELTVFNNQLYFASGDDDDFIGSEMWTSDGTTVGTAIKFDIFPNNLNPFFGYGSGPGYFNIFNNELYFTARSYNETTNQIIGKELWKTDGTTASLVKDIKTGNLESGLNIPRFTVFQNELYFIASDDTTSDYELWKTDGTESGTTKQVSVANTGVGFQFVDAIVYNNKLFYHNFQQLWETDGTPSGTNVLTGNTEEIIQTNSGSLFSFQNKIWFAGYKIGNGTELTSLFDNTLNVVTFNNEKLKIYPNPTTQDLYVSNIKSITEFLIYDVSGKIIKAGRVPITQSKIDVSALRNGYYFLKISNSEMVETLPFIKR